MYMQVHAGRWRLNLKEPLEVNGRLEVSKVGTSPQEVRFEVPG
jgi:hypothetical protein